MAATPDDPEVALSAAEAAHLAARDTVPIDVRPDRLARRDTVRLPTQRGGGAARPTRAHAPLVLASGVATGWAAAISLVPVLVAVALAQGVEPGGSLAAATRLGLAGWLLGHGVPVETGAGRLALAPLGLTVLAAWRMVRAGVHTTRGIRARGGGSVRRAFAVAGAVGVWYGLLGGLAALVIGDGAAPAVSAMRATANLAVFGAMFGLAGAVGSTGVLDAARRGVPEAVRDGVRIGLVVTLMLLGAAAATAGISLALGGGEAADVFGAYRTGVAGQAGITLICLAYGPNAAVWATAYLIGPGFAVGADTVVRVTDVTVGGLPAVPIFAGLPAGPLGAPGALLLGVPVLVAMAGGWLLVRARVEKMPVERPARRARGSSGRYREMVPPRQPELPPMLAWTALLGAAGVAGVVSGLLLGAAALASAGSLGDGRLSTIGPVAWQVATIGAAVAAVGTLLGAGAARTTRR